MPAIDSLFAQALELPDKERGELAARLLHTLEPDGCRQSASSGPGLAGSPAGGSPAHVGPGDVLLMHEGQQWTLDALPRIVTSLHAAGYELVTMHDLFSA